MCVVTSQLEAMVENLAFCYQGICSSFVVGNLLFRSGNACCSGASFPETLVSLTLLVYANINCVLACLYIILFCVLHEDCLNQREHVKFGLYGWLILLNIKVSRSVNGGWGGNDEGSNGEVTMSQNGCWA